MNFLKNYVVEFCRCDFELAHLFGTEKLLEKNNYKLLEAKFLAEGRIEEPVLKYVYLQKKTNKKDFFQVLYKHPVPTKKLQKFISNASKLDASKHVKKKIHQPTSMVSRSLKLALQSLSVYQ